MRISELTSNNKPYIRISKGNKRVDVPIIPKNIYIPAGKIDRKKYSYVGCENIKVQFKGKIVKLNWTFNHNSMTLYCTSGRQAYKWKNIKVATITHPNGKKEQIVVSKRDYGDETERRKFKRYATAQQIYIKQENNVYKADTVDISYGGVGFTIKRNAKIIPSLPIEVIFDDKTKVKARLVRSVFRGDGSQLLGCFVSKRYRFQMAKIVKIEEELLESERRGGKSKDKDTDDGWYDDEIKRWH